MVCGIQVLQNFFCIESLYHLWISCFTLNHVSKLLKLLVKIDRMNFINCVILEMLTLQFTSFAKFFHAIIPTGYHSCFSLGILKWNSVKIFKPDDFCHWIFLQGHLLVLENFNLLKLNHGTMEVGYTFHNNLTLHQELEENGQMLSVSMGATTDMTGNLVLGKLNTPEQLLWPFSI